MQRWKIVITYNSVQKEKKQKKTKGIELMIFFVWILNESWEGREVHL